ncbi:MAG: hypothetical protein J7M34_11710 [Anaerolineae bacterium]|nr:hypothetical protein [Anaerolineae bacterium]
MRRRSDQKLIELLAAQADNLIQGRSDVADMLASCPELAGEAESLMALAARLAGAIQPVRPNEAYRAHLREGLVQAAQRKQARRAMAPQRGRVPRWQWMLGAAAVGSAVSVLGVVAYRLRSRHGGRTGQVFSG